MSDEVDDLVKKCVELRKAGRLEESILLARRATSVNDKSANAWWQLALSVAEREGDEAAIEYFKKTVEFASQYGYGWYRLGNAYKKAMRLDDAVMSWETACRYDGDFEWTRYNLIDAYSARKIDNEKGKILEQLIELEVRGKLRTSDLHLIAIEYHNKRNYYSAIPYYKRYIARAGDATGYTNLSLAYSSAEVGQELDAADCCHLALDIAPESKRANDLLSNLAPKLRQLKTRVFKETGETKIIPVDSWYENYINPFELLQFDQNGSTLEIKEFQKAKKMLLQEIELEDGSVSWVSNLKIDKSRAIKLSDELTDQALFKYHQWVYQYDPLLNFLSRGDLTLFCYDEHDVPIDLLFEINENENFIRWLGGFFSKQYDSIFTAALATGNIDLIELVLDGRRFVTPDQEDDCFATAKRNSKNWLDELEQLEGKVKTTKLTHRRVKSVLDKGSLGKVLEMLPPSFQEVQAKAAQIIRNISIDLFNCHGDADLAKEVLGLAGKFALKSPSIRTRIDEDIIKLNELIANEKKDEIYLKLGSKSLEITRSGIKYGDDVIRSDEAETLRWGITIDNSAGREIYQFKIVVGGSGSATINIFWESITDIEKQNEFFRRCVGAIFAYILPKVLDKMRAAIDGGRTVYVGSTAVSKSGVTLKAQGWFSTKEELCYWGSLRSEIINGSVVINSSMNQKASASMSLADVDNAWILHILISEGMMK